MGITLPPLPENVTGLDSLAVYTNNATEQWFGALMLMLIGYFFLFSFHFDNKRNAFMVSMIFVTFSGIIFYIMGITSLQILEVTFFLGLIGIAMNYIKRN